MLRFCLDSCLSSPGCPQGQAPSELRIKANILRKADMAAITVCLLFAAVLGLAKGQAMLEPKSGSYFGVSVDFATTTVSQYMKT